MLPHPDSGLNPYYEEPCFLTPEDDPSMLDPKREQPVGPMWWLGLWPEDGINSLEDLEKYVDGRLSEMIRLNWSEPASLGDLALMLGQQAVTNAISYLAHFGRGNHPQRPKADELKDIDGVQTALESLLIYLRHERAAGTTPVSLTGPDGGGSPCVEAEIAAAAPVGTTVLEPTIMDAGGAGATATVAKKPTGLVVDRDHFTIVWNGRSCPVGNTREFAFVECLSGRPGKFYSHAELMDAAWDGDTPETNTIQKIASNVRKKFRAAGFTDVTIKAQKGHYALILP